MEDKKLTDAQLDEVTGGVNINDLKQFECGYMAIFNIYSWAQKNQGTLAIEAAECTSCEDFKTKLMSHVVDCSDLAKLTDNDIALLWSKKDEYFGTVQA